MQRQMVIPDEPRAAHYMYLSPKARPEPVSPVPEPLSLWLRELQEPDSQAIPGHHWEIRECRREVFAGERRPLPVLESTREMDALHRMSRVFTDHPTRRPPERVLDGVRDLFDGARLRLLD